MPLHDQRVVESAIFLNSIEGLQRILGRIAVNYGEKPLPVVVVAGDFAQREIQRQFNGNWTYPFIAISIQALNLNLASYNNNLRRGGKSVAVEDKILTFKLIPITASFLVRYYTQDNAQLLNFSKRWIYRQKDVQYRLENRDINVNIKVRLDTSLIPPPQDITDWGNIFQLQTSCEIDSYIGEVETTTRIKQINLSTNLWNSDKKNVKLVDTMVILPKV